MSEPISKSIHRAPALIFDLDGTLVDSVYQHVPDENNHSIEIVLTPA